MRAATPSVALTGNIVSDYTVIYLELIHGLVFHGKPMASPVTIHVDSPWTNTHSLNLIPTQSV